MVKYGFLFPGQGAQFVGMGKSLYDYSPIAQTVFDAANEILDYDLTSICFNGPEEDLMATEYAQPAIFVTSLAVLEEIKTDYPELEPAACLGLSLGEYTALVAAGSLSFEDGLRLVQTRAEAMNDAAIQTKGTMASVLGMALEACQKICDAIEGVVIANVNSPQQIVISGEVEAVAEASEKCREAGAKRVVPLQVSGAFHSHLMLSARKRLEEAARGVAFQKPYCSFVSNFTAQLESDPETIRENLVQQLTGSVLWSQSMQRIIQEGITEFIEIGPGTVLKGLAKKIDSDVSVTCVEKSEEVTRLAEVLEAI